MVIILHQFNARISIFDIFLGKGLDLSHIICYYILANGEKQFFTFVFNELNEWIKGTFLLFIQFSTIFSFYPQFSFFYLLITLTDGGYYVGRSRRKSAWE